MHKDTILQEAIDVNPNMIVPFYLMCAYAYYEKDEPIASDAFFDNLAKVYLEKYDELTHRHRDVVSKEDLEAGTFMGKYPSIVEGAVEDFKNRT